MYNQIFNQTNLANERPAPSRSEADEALTKQPPSSGQNAPSQQQQQRDGPRQTLSYTMKLSVKKKPSADPNMNEHEHGVVRQFSASGSTAQRNNDANETSNNHVALGSAGSRSGVSGLYGPNANQQDNNDQKKYKRISEKMQDHQRFFKNLIELPNNNSNKVSNIMANSNDGNNGCGTAGNTEGRGLVKKHLSNQQNSAQIYDTQNESDYKGGLKPTHVYGGVGSIGSAGGADSGYASKDIKKVGSTSSAYSSKNISANQRAAAPAGSLHQNSKYLSSHETMPQYDKNNTEQNQQQQMIQIQYFATRSRLSQSSQKKTAQNRIANAGADAIIQGTSHQQYAPQIPPMGAQNTNFDSLKQALNHKNNTTMSPQIQANHQYGGGQNPQPHPQKANVAALNRTQASALNPTSISKEIYETLNKSIDGGVQQTSGKAQDWQAQQQAPATCPSLQSKKGHQVYDELRAKYQQFSGNGAPQNGFSKNFTTGQNFSHIKNSGSNKFNGQASGFVGMNAGLNATSGASNFDLNAQTSGQAGQTKQNRRMVVAADSHQKTPPLVDGKSNLQINFQQPNDRQPSSSRLRERGGGGDLKYFLDTQDQQRTGQKPKQPAEVAGTNSHLLNSANSFTNGPIASINKSTTQPNQNLQGSPRQQLQNSANKMGMLRSTNNDNTPQQQQQQNRNAFSRSQSRVQKQDFQALNKSQTLAGAQGPGQQQNQQAQDGKYQFNQYKNVININGQLEKGFAANLPGANGGSGNRAIGAIAGAMPSLPPNAATTTNGNMNHQFNAQSRLNQAFKTKTGGIPIIFKNKDSVPQAGQGNQIMGQTGQQQSHFHHNNAKSQGPPQQQRDSKRFMTDDADDLPPKISQNHYRHIHEQRDFTLENLSLAGETEEVLYDDYKIFADFEWQLDLDIQELISKQNHEAKPPQQRCKTQEKPSTKSRGHDLNPSYRCRAVGESTTLRLKNQQTAMNIFTKFLETFEATSHELSMYQNLISPNTDLLRAEYTLLNRQQIFINKIREDLQYLQPSPTTPLQQNMMANSMYQGYQQTLISLYKKLDNIQRIKQKYHIATSGGQTNNTQAQHIFQYLQQEARDYARSQVQIIARFKGLLNSKNQMIRKQFQDGMLNLKDLQTFSADEIINSATRKQIQQKLEGVDEQGDDDQSTTTQLNDNNAKNKKNSKNENIPKDPAAIKKMAFSREESQMLITENINGIPAKEIKLAKILMDKPAPHCSAQSWSIYDLKTNTLLFGKGERDRREVASLTKIMTAYVVYKLMEKFKVDESYLVTISGDASSVIGTSAELIEGDTLTIKQLLYGLMLPSGNDAAHSLAETFGTWLKKEKDELEDKRLREEKERKLEQKEEDDKRRSMQNFHEETNADILSSSPSNQYLQTQDKEANAQTSSSSHENQGRHYDDDNTKTKGAHPPETPVFFESNQMKYSQQNLAAYRSGKEITNIKKSPYVAKSSQFRNYQEVLYFLEEMNKTAEELNLKSSFYDSPHGLSNSNNRSSALDVAKLATQAMKNSRFREIVQTKFYTVKKNTNGNKKTYKWYNTHLMLGQRGINGIKTGITPAAGPCLCTSLNNDGIELIICIINTKNMDIRWAETWKLANWALQRLKTIEKFQNNKLCKNDTNGEQIQHKRLLNRIRHL